MAKIFPPFWGGEFYSGKFNLGGGKYYFFFFQRGAETIFCPKKKKPNFQKGGKKKKQMVYFMGQPGLGWGGKTGKKAGGEY